MLYDLSIRARLTLFVATLALTVILVAGVSVISLKEVDWQTQTLDRKWLKGTAILGELSDRVSEFRIAEGYRALAQDAAARGLAESLASQHRGEIDNLAKAYADLRGGEAKDDLDRFGRIWAGYQLAHDSWARKDTDGAIDDPAMYDSEAHRLYVLTDAAVERLIEDNTAAAHVSAAAASSISHRATMVAAAASAAAVAFALWLIFQIGRSVTRPLEHITHALSRLAAGDSDVRLPAFERRDELGEMAKAFEIFRENATALELAHKATLKAQKEASMQARHDSLTGLPNRRVFAADLEAALHRTRRGMTTYSLLLIDLDNFKPVNDLLGHPAGDQVLQEVARRIQAIVRKTDTAVRLGGDEFAIIAEGSDDPNVNVETAIRLANRVLAAIHEPILLDTGGVEVGASIGITLCRPENADPEILLHEADIAMYRAKRDGKGVFRFFEPSMDAELRERAALESDFKTALRDGHIQPYYQPLVEIRENRVCAFEVLARWTHPVRGFVSPEVFVPLAEQLGLISELTESVLRQACRDARLWSDDIRISVNFSPTQFTDPKLSDCVLTILAEEAFPPTRLEIEVTETALVSDVAVAQAILQKLRSAGITVALDDFGTGYSTLSHLGAFKFDKLKIDRSFVMGMLDNPESEKIVEAILNLAQNLRVAVVAEGIENPLVLRQLTKRGCEYGQGYFFGKAMPANSVREILDVPLAA